MTEDDLDLGKIREGIDRIDEQLVDLLLSRERLVEQVMRYKRVRHMRVVDRSREDQMLDSIERLAESKGLDPRVARQVLRTVIDSFTLLEVEELGGDL